MKKLALALVCLVSVAFFASCSKDDNNPKNPSISVYAPNTEFVQDGATVDLFADSIKFGFQMASNADSQKELASLRVVIAVDTIETEWANLPLSGTTYTYTDSFSFDAKEIIGEVVISATVIDADGKTATATIKLNINLSEIPLEVSNIEWVKTGHNVQDLSAYGLEWKTTNYKDPFTHIIPAEGCMLFACSGYGDAFAAITTDIKLATYFNTLMETASLDSNINTTEYNKVDCNPANKDYNDLLITKDAEDNLHAILIKHATVGSAEGATRITITGQAK